MAQPMNLHEAARVLGITWMTAYRWLHEGRLERAVPPGPRRRRRGHPRKHYVTRASVLKLQQERSKNDGDQE